MMKIFFCVCLGALLAQKANANCAQYKAEAEKECDASQLAAARTALSQGQSFLATSNPGPGVAATTTQSNLNGSQMKLQAFLGKCGPAVKNCVTTCTTESANPNPSISTPAKTNKAFCEGSPTQNLEAAKSSSMDISQMLPLIAALLQALGMQSEDTETSPPQCIQYPQLLECQRTDTTQTAGAGNFTDGGFREPGMSMDGDMGPLATGAVAPGQGAAISRSGPAPGGGVGAASMGAGGGYGGGYGRERGRSEDDGTPKINLSSSSGGGRSGGGGGSAYGSRGGGPGNTAANSRTATEDPKAVAAVQKAMQQRGLASDGPLGGVTGAHSLDNFAKVEKRVQSERNTLNEK